VGGAKRDVQRAFTERIRIEGGTLPYIERKLQSKRRFVQHQGLVDVLGQTPGYLIDPQSPPLQNLHTRL